MKVVPLGLVALLVGCSLTTGAKNPTTVADVERRLDESLHIGSTRQEVEAWLKAQNIEHSYSDGLLLTSTTDAKAPGGGKSTGYIQAIIRDTDRSFFVEGAIQLYFWLGEDNKLLARRVQWVGTGP